MLTNKEVISVLIIPFFIFWLCACRQKPIPYDQNLLTKSTELDLRTSEKRGIMSSSGIVYLVGKDMKILTAYQKDKILWCINIIKTYGDPFSGKNEIWFISLEKNYLFVRFAKHCEVNVDINTGKTKDIACD